MTFFTFFHFIGLICNLFDQKFCYSSIKQISRSKLSSRQFIFDKFSSNFLNFLRFFLKKLLLIVQNFITNASFNQKHCFRSNIWVIVTRKRYRTAVKPHKELRKDFQLAATCFMSSDKYNETYYPKLVLQ